MKTNIHNSVPELQQNLQPFSINVSGGNLGPDYMANFSRGWNFVAITWWTSARAEMKLRAKSLRRIKMTSRTRIMKIGALLLPQFGLLAELNFQLFWMVTAYEMMEPGTVQHFCEWGGAKWNAEVRAAGVSVLGGSGACFPGKFFK